MSSWRWWKDRWVDDVEYNYLTSNLDLGGLGCLFTIICISTSIFAFTHLLENKTIGIIVGLIIGILLPIIIKLAYKQIIIGFIIFLLIDCSIVNNFDHESFVYIKWDIIANFIKTLPLKATELLSNTFDATIDFLFSGF